MPHWKKITPTNKSRSDLRNDEVDIDDNFSDSDDLKSDTVFAKIGES